MCHPFMVTVASCDAEGYMADKIFAIGGSAGLVVIRRFLPGSVPYAFSRVLGYC